MSSSPLNAEVFGAVGKLLLMAGTSTGRGNICIRHLFSLSGYGVRERQLSVLQVL
jgi:hypothetical protein